MKKANVEWEEACLTRNDIAEPKVGLIFPVCDGDQKHFERFRGELDRLGFPYVPHFDHCCQATKNFFQHRPLCCGVSEDDDSKSFFDESFRQRALDVLVRLDRFTHMIHMDVDETLERDAPAKIAEISRARLDVASFKCLDLWGTGRREYRVDGGFNHSQREKLFLLTGNRLKYPHPSSHAPNVFPPSRDKSNAVVVRCHHVRILHWGIMDMEDARIHKERWDTIYTRKLGSNPFGSYEVYFDPNQPAKVAPVPEDVYEGDKP